MDDIQKIEKITGGQVAQNVKGNQIQTQNINILQHIKDVKLSQDDFIIVEFDIDNYFFEIKNINAIINKVTHNLINEYGLSFKYITHGKVYVPDEYDNKLVTGIAYKFKEIKSFFQELQESYKRTTRINISKINSFLKNLSHMSFCEEDNIFNDLWEILTSYLVSREGLSCNTVELINFLETENFDLNYQELKRLKVVEILKKIDIILMGEMYFLTSYINTTPTPK